MLSAATTRTYKYFMHVHITYYIIVSSFIRHHVIDITGNTIRKRKIDHFVFYGHRKSATLLLVNHNILLCISVYNIVNLVLFKASQNIINLDSSRIVSTNINTKLQTNSSSRNVRTLMNNKAIKICIFCLFIYNKALLLV